MTEHAGPEVWGSPAWRSTATAWLDDELGNAGIRRTGEVAQPRIRPWATLLTAPTSAGRVWLKAAAPATAFEVTLYPLLRRRSPGMVLAPLAVDEDRGWLLLPDGGEHLGDLMAGEHLAAAMTTVLPRYAELQRAIAPDVERLVQIGVADMRPVRMRERFEEALAVTAAFVTASGDAEHRDLWERAATMRGTVASWCDALAASPVPATLDHNDLHARNVLVGAGGIEAARIYDWGDSVVAHPFASLLVTLRAMRAELRVADDDPTLLRLRDAYLEVFEDVGSRAVLVETAEIACHLGKVARSLTWHRALSMQGSSGAYADAPLFWLAEILQPSWLGTTTW